VEINEEKIDRWDHDDSLKVCNDAWHIAPQLCEKVCNLEMFIWQSTIATDFIHI
jgi:hypothetical protein